MFNNAKIAELQSQIDNMKWQLERCHERYWEDQQRLAVLFDHLRIEIVKEPSKYVLNKV